MTPTTPTDGAAPTPFTRYQIFVAGLMAFLRFAVILDFMIMSPLGALIMAWRMKPVAEHLLVRQEKSAFLHLLHTVAEPRYLTAFATTALLTTGGFILMPFSSAFTVNSLGIGLDRLPTIY